MHNVLNAEFYKAGKKRSVLICIISAFIIGFILTIPSVVTSDNGIVCGKEWFYSMAVEISSFMFIFALIVPAIVLTSEFNDNTMKNMLFSGTSRIHLYISKILIIGIVIVIINFALTFGGTIIVTMKNGWGSNFQVKDLMSLVSSTGKMSLVMYAYCCIFSLIALIVRNLIASIALSYGVRLLEAFLVIMANNFKWLEWIKKIILGNMDEYFLKKSCEIKYIVSGTLLSLIVVVVTILIAILVFQYQEVKS